MGYVTYVASDGESTRLEAQPGVSIMRLATSQAIPGIVAECGGNLSCATCHVRVADDWFALVGNPSDGERSLLAFADQPGPTSRLSCQIKVSDELEGMTVLLPERQY